MRDSRAPFSTCFLVLLLLAHAQAFVVPGPRPLAGKGMGVGGGMRKHRVNSRRNLQAMDVSLLQHVDVHAQVISDHVDWMTSVVQGIASTEPAMAAANSGAAAAAVVEDKNIVFATFDKLVDFVESLIIRLHDELVVLGAPYPYGLSIIFFTFGVRALLLPLTFFQIESTEKVKALQPVQKEIQSKYGANKNVQNQLVASLYEKAKVNPLAGCLPAIAQIPVFLSLYNSFFALAKKGVIDEPFLWIPNLEGPVYGERSADWLLANWHDFVPSLGWHDTLLYLTLPALLVVAQSLSMQALTPPATDEASQRTSQILKYLPLMIGYFALSVPSALGLYWLTSNIVSTGTSVGIRKYLEFNPVKIDISLDDLAEPGKGLPFVMPTKEEMLEEARIHALPSRARRMPSNFV